MTDRAVTRRAFLGTTTAGAVAVSCAGPSVFAAERPLPELVVAQGPDGGRNAAAAIAALGGISRYVKRGQIVGLLPNAQGDHPGCSADIGVLTTVIKLCQDAGASEVRCLTWLPQQIWDHPRARFFRAPLEEAGAKLSLTSTGPQPAKPGDPPPPMPPEVAALWKTLDVPKGVALEQVRVIKALDECQVFISLPIFKDHIGTRFTGVLKNSMGVSHPADNGKFHPSFEGGDLAHLEQCVADLNTVVRRADLCVVSAMQCLKTNGPFGPGEVIKPSKVVAGSDPVALDCYGAGLLGLDGPKVGMVRKASEHGLGQIDLAKVRVETIDVS
jgi:uncharacterized protein (DUF362 family)